MHQSDMKALVGVSLNVHGVRHLCVAALEDRLLMLQYSKLGMPVQFVVAHSPSFFEGCLIWAWGEYFPFPLYESEYNASGLALLDAAMALKGK